MSSTIIEGNVIAIIDQYRVLLNVGTRNGVRQGMKFMIYTVEKNVKDPITGQELGDLFITKAEVIVVSAQEKMSVAESPEIEEVEQVITLPSLVRKTGKKERKSLPISKKAAEQILKINYETEIGDPVRALSSYVRVP